MTEQFNLVGYLKNNLVFIISRGKIKNVQHFDQNSQGAEIYLTFSCFLRYKHDKIL